MKSHRILQLLPEIVRRTVHEGTAISDVVAVMEQLHAPVEDVLDTFPTYLDPYRCPEAFVPMLAHWVGLGWLLADSFPDVADVEHGALRELIVHSSELAKARGTEPGLARFLRLATGVDTFTVLPDPATGFGIDVRGPAAAKPHRALARRITLHEKPAFVTASLGFGQEASERLVSTTLVVEVIEPEPPPAATAVF